MSVQKAKVVSLAREWIGTPYQHQAVAQGAGTDCLGLIRGVWIDLLGHETAKAPNYSQDWSEVSGTEVLLDAARLHLIETNLNFASAGDVVLFRMRANAVAKHLGILGSSSSGYPTLIHAYSGRGVTETAMTDAWRRRAVAQFEFPAKVQ